MAAQIEETGTQHLLGVIDIALQQDTTMLIETVSRFTVQDINKMIDNLEKLKTMMPKLESSLIAIRCSRTELEFLAKSASEKKPAGALAQDKSASKMQSQKDWTPVKSNNRPKKQTDDEIDKIARYPFTCQLPCRHKEECHAKHCKFVHLNEYFWTQVEKKKLTCRNCNKEGNCWSAQDDNYWAAQDDKVE